MTMELAAHWGEEWQWRLPLDESSSQKSKGKTYFAMGQGYQLWIVENRTILLAAGVGTDLP